MKKPKIRANLKTYQRKWRINNAAVRSYLFKVWKALMFLEDLSVPAETEISVTFVNNSRMQWYNLSFRKMDYATDVLSFPVNEITPEGDHYLGDILISVEKAWEQAHLGEHSLDRELEILLLHGVLHLLGFDHETDSGEMDALEHSVRKKVLDNRRLALPAGSTVRA